MRSIPLVVRVRARNALEHLPALSVRQLRVERLPIWRIRHLRLEVLDIIFWRELRERRAGWQLTIVDVRTRRLVLTTKSGIPHLRGQAILEVQETRLAHALDLRAGRAHLGLLEPPTRSRVPPEDSEWPVADLALVPELLLALQVSAAGRRVGDGSKDDLPCGRKDWDRDLGVSRHA